MGWENPGPARQVVIAGPGGELLVYYPTVGAGNLVLAIAADPGQDAFGNQFLDGLTIYGANGPTGGRISFHRKIDDATISQIFANDAGQLFILAGSSSPVAGGIISLTAEDAAGGFPGTLQISSAGLTLVGNGQSSFTGSFSNLHVDWIEPVVGGGNTLIQNNFTVFQKTAYTGELVGGLWTCKAEGFYDTGLFISNSLAGTATATGLIRVNGSNVAMEEETHGVDVTATMTGLHLSAGDIVSFLLKQNSGVNVSMSGYFTISKRVLG